MAIPYSSGFTHKQTITKTPIQSNNTKHTKHPRRREHKSRAGPCTIRAQPLTAGAVPAAHQPHQQHQLGAPVRPDFDSPLLLALGCWVSSTSILITHTPNTKSNTCNTVNRLSLMPPLACRSRTVVSLAPACRLSPPAGCVPTPAPRS
jgi:hypothetical protein